MKTILSLVATTGLLIGSAAIGYAQQGSTPNVAAQGSRPSGAAQDGSTPSGAAPFGSAGPSGNLPGQQMQERGDRARNVSIEDRKIEVGFPRRFQRLVDARCLGGDGIAELT
jgi:hypothetical protein